MVILIPTFCAMLYLFGAGATIEVAPRFEGNRDAQIAAAWLWPIAWILWAGSACGRLLLPVPLVPSARVVRR